MYSAFFEQIKHRKNFNRALEILLVEDNIGDIRLIQECFKEINSPHHLHIARDGQEALDFLYHQGKYKEAPLPDLIILDINLPKKNGHLVLEEIKKDKNLEFIPVIIFSSSSDEKDIFRAYELYANSYIVKPHDYSEFLEIIHKIDQFWMQTVQLPTYRDYL